MTKLISINSSLSNKYKKEVINGREHYVVNMKPLRGDTSMNQIFYPMSEVEKTFFQLNHLPAPDSHPIVDGKKVSAFHPLAINAHNIGAFVRAPRMVNKDVICELVLDIEVANNSDSGKELVKRIETNSFVGVSTGVIINTLINNSGKDDFGQDYQYVGNDYQFDHVAVLLNEEAAGKHAGTELLITNAIFEQPKEVKKKMTTENTSVEVTKPFYDKENLALAIMANSKTEFNEKDKARLLAMSESEIVSALVTETSVDEAKAIVTNSGVDFDGYAEFQTNKADYDLWKTEKELQLAELKKEIVTNSDLTDELLEGKGKGELEAISKLIKKTDVVKHNSTTTSPDGDKEAVALDFTF